MDVVGILCEYDPFHSGHQRQFELIRERCPGAAIVCLMSGCFTQRGMPTLHAPAFRAERALRAGADLVLELPAAWAVRDGEHFALGGVSILSRLGFVHYLSFGAEDKLEALLPITQLLCSPTASYQERLKSELAAGKSYAAAQGAALAEQLPAYAEAIEKPNNILALCYLRALSNLHSSLLPLPVCRKGDYHDKALNGSTYPSATAVRAAFLSGSLQAASEACGYPLPLAPVCPPDGLDDVLLYCLRHSAVLSELPYCTEGLENRLYAAARESVSREALLNALKTKRYPYARLSRLCCHALLGVTEQLLSDTPLPPYVRLLGFRKQSAALLRSFTQSDIPIISKAADGDRQHPIYQLDIRAYDLWALGAKQPAGLMLRTGVITL
ncbi:MAG: nucleotidyltransferase family protein [Eubacteriales bacterium]|nr:nucleotidyltransferase family protein [Eubacteriales bacterium]